MENLTTATIQPNEQYEQMAPRWRRVRDVVEGEYRLKQHDLRVAGISTVGSIDAHCNSLSYLRIINPSDTSTYNRERNAGYINGARLFNATSRTLAGLMGMLFRSEPTGPDDAGKLDYLFYNVDGTGMGMSQQARGVASDVIQVGRDGLLVDMPRNDEGVEITKAMVDGGFRASIQEYKAESIIDWHEKTINGVRRLDLLVLKEYDTEIDEEDALNIRRKSVEKYIIYRLDKNGVTVQTVKNSDGGKMVVGDQMPIAKSDGSQFDRIPFTFIGSKNNDPDVDKPVLETVCDINLGHYQESANLASSSYQLSAAQPWVADTDFQNAINNNKSAEEPAAMGEESLIVLGSGGKFEITAAPVNTMASGLKKEYRDEMVEAGAQIITQGGQPETAEAARIKHASDVSELSIVADNISDAYTKSIEFAGMFMGVDTADMSYQINRNFFDSKMTPDELRSLIESWQAAAISKPVLDQKLVDGGVIDKSVNLEEMNTLISEELPGLNLDDGTNGSSDPQPSIS